MTDHTMIIERRMTTNGYEAARVDGRFWAWRRKLADGSELRVCTIDHDLDGDPDAEEWYCGRHADAGAIGCDDALTLARAMALAKLLPSPATLKATEFFRSMSVAEIEGRA
jgi:hypothetical protein